LRAICLLLPVLLPAWRFFQTIEPSPRIEVDVDGEWVEARPRPLHVSWRAMLARLFWNPTWNETLYLTSCSERVLEDRRAHARAEILARLKASRFRLVEVQREGDGLVRETRLTSDDPP